MSTAKPTISVLINNYNYGQYIAEAIDSVLAQTHPDFELIIVDDGSSDNSREVIETYDDKRIRTIFKENGGQASSFNIGIAEAKGDLVCLLDSDDWWKPEKLSTILKWHEHLDGHYVLLQHAMDVWQDGRKRPYKAAMLSGDLFQHTRESGSLGFFVGTSGLTFPRSILDQVLPVPEAFRISADAFLTRTSFTLGPVYSIPTALGYYRQHQNAVLGNENHKQADFIEHTLFPNLNAFYREHDINYQYDFDTFGKRYDLARLLTIRRELQVQFSELAQQYETIVLFGAGKHTAWLEKILGENRYLIAAILDDHPSTATFWDLSVTKTSDWNPPESCAIVLSSDASQNAMRKRVQALYGREVPCIDLYEGFPPGPYRK